MRLFLLPAAVLLTGTGFAMDPGTYRPGQPYHSSQASNANACSAQCQSDSQCRGWNFVKVKSNAPVGICEYNARRAAPVSSPVSTSGDSIAASRTSTQMVSAGTRTLRIGAPTTYQPHQAVAPHAGTRRIVSQPIAHARPAQTAAYKPAPVSSFAKPYVRRPVHALDTLPQKAQPARVLKFQHSLDDAPALSRAINHERHVAPAPRATQVQRPQTMVQRPVVTRRSDIRHNASTRTSAGPKPLPLPKSEAKPLVAQTPAATIPVQTSAQRLNSLYGSLHDDVKVPKPLAPTDIPLDSEAPIPTVSSVPTQAVMKDKLYGMAGPQR